MLNIKSEVNTLKQNGIYLPDHVSEKYIKHVVFGEKVPFTLSAVRRLASIYLEQSFIDTRMIHAALLEDPEFSLKIPDLYSPELHPYLMNILNGLSGGEFAQYIKGMMIFLLNGKRDVPKEDIEPLTVDMPWPFL